MISARNRIMAPWSISSPLLLAIGTVDITLISMFLLSGLTLLCYTEDG